MKHADNIERIPKPQHGSQAWLDLRDRDAMGRVRFGTSESASILDRSMYETRSDLILRKMAGSQPSVETPAMRFGNLMEAILIEEAAKKIRLNFETPDVMFGRDRFIATLDGWNQTERIIVEAKTTQKFAIEGIDDVPEQWLWQTTAQRWACHAEAVWLVSLDRRLEISVIEIPYREDMMNALVQEATRLGHALDDRRIEPYISEMAASHIAKMFPADPQKTIEIGQQGIDLLMMWDDATRRKKEAEADEEFAKDALARMMLDATTATHAGREVVSWKQRKGRSILDQARLVEEMPEIVEKFTKIGSPYRVMVNKVDRP
jgi:predicted phage-related endonuclease